MEEISGSFSRMILSRGKGIVGEECSENAQDVRHSSISSIFYKGRSCSHGFPESRYSDNTFVYGVK